MALAGLLPPSVLDRVSQAVAYFGIFDVRTVEPTSANWAVVERMAHWQAGWYMFLDQPWFGVGAGNYADAYDGYFLPGWTEALGHAHNFYLNMLAELGVIGGALLVMLVVVTFRHLGGTLVRSWDQKGALWRGVLAGSVGGMVVFCVHNLFDSLFVHSVQVQVGLLLGLGFAAVNQLQEPAT
jgi:putative inorganic carbon (HCO3(-)) transporter